MLHSGKMADEKLRRELISLGYTPGPITDSTRRILEKKLEKLRAEAKKAGKSSRSSDNARRDRRQEPSDESDEESDYTWVTHTTDQRRHGQFQTEERLSRDTVQEERGRRADNTRQEAASWRGDESSTEERAPWRRERASLPGGNPDRSSLGYNRHSSGNLESSSLGYKYSSDNPDRSSLGYNRHSSGNLESSSLGYKYSSDNPDRSSLGYNRHSSDNPDRSSLGYNRHSSDNPDRSSLGYKYSSDNPDRSSLGYNRHSSDNLESRSLGYNKYPSDNLDSSSLRYIRNLSDNLERSSLGSNRYFGDELRYRPTGDSSRDQSTSPYSSVSRAALDSQPYKTHPGLRQGKVSHLKPTWSKKLEYYLSRLLRVLCLILVLVFAGILIVKSGMLGTSPDNDMKLLPSDCEGREDSFCKAKQKEITFRILSELYDFLSLEAGSFDCGNPSGLNSKCIPIERAKEHVMNVSGYEAKKFDAALDWMLSSDQHLGIWAKGENTEELVTAVKDVFCVESSRPILGFTCRLKNALYTAISNLFLALIGIFILWIILIFLRYHWQRLEEEEKQMFAMVEKIIDVLKHHYKDYTLGREQYPFVGILHVRDSLIMAQDRKPMKKVWDRAVKFIEHDESRVRTVMQRVAGADLMVWLWIQTRNEYPR